jgi:hypothetical protein
VCARVAQSIVHIASNANRAVHLRFTAYCTQLGAWAYKIVTIISSSSRA